MSNDEQEGEEGIRLKGVRKRKWGKYVAEIRAGNRSRISLGSYFTAEGAGRAYDTALLCLRGPSATGFNFPDSKFNLEVANVERNPSPQAIRTAAIRVGSLFDVVPAKYFGDNNNKIPDEAPENNVAEATNDAQIRVEEKMGDATNNAQIRVEEKMGEEGEVIGESSDAKSLVQSAQLTLSEDSVRTFDLMRSFG